MYEKGHWNPWNPGVNPNAWKLTSISNDITEAKAVTLDATDVAKHLGDKKRE